MTHEIVGVVGDAKYRTLRDPVIRTMYIPWMQRDGDPQPSSFAYIVRAASGDPRRLIPELAAAVREADPALRVTVAAVTLDSAALLAAWLPARGAANIDPLVALRHD